MKRDITSESYFGGLMTSLSLLIFFMVIITSLGIFLVLNADESSYIMCFALGNGLAIVIILPDIIYYGVLYKRFKKLLKSSKTSYGFLEEVTYESFIASLFSRGGWRVVIDGHYSRSIYPYNLVKKLPNTQVEYILDGEIAYLINPVDF